MDAFTVSSAVSRARLAAVLPGPWRGPWRRAARTGSVAFTVTNTAQRDLVAHARVVAEPGADPTWFQVADPRRTAPAGSTHQFDVRVDVQARAAGGTYRFRLDVMDAEEPDEYEGEGPWITIEVPAPRTWRVPTRWLAAAGVVAAAALLVGLVVLVVRLQRPADLALDTTVRDFGVVALGQGSHSSLVTVHNRGGASAAVIPAFAGADPKDFVVLLDTCSGQSLPAGSSCRVLVDFQPTAPGPREAVFLVTAASAPASAKTPLIIFTGTGQGAAAPVTFSPASVALSVPTPPASVQVSGPQADAADTVLSVANTGQRAFRVQSVQLRGAGAEFRVVSGCDGAVLEPGQSCRVAVLFASASATRGDLTGELVVTDDAGPGPNQVVPISGYRGPYVLPGA